MLSFTELLLQLLFFKFHPKNGIRPMTKDKIHKIATISLAVFPVISSLYLQRKQQTFIRFRQTKEAVQIAVGLNWMLQFEVLFLSVIRSSFGKTMQTKKLTDEVLVLLNLSCICADVGSILH